MSMMKLIAWVAFAGAAWGAGGCSGKTERGSSSEAAPADKPASGPAQLAPARRAALPTGPASEQPVRHLLMVVELEPSTRAARTLSAKPVELPLPRRRGRAPQEAWRVDVLSATGAVLFSAPLKDASEVRGEFPDAQGRLSGVKVQQRVAAVTLRLPLLSEARAVRVVDVAAASGETELGRVDYPQVSP